MNGDKITNLELKNLIDQKKVFVLDVRTLEEFTGGHLWPALHRHIDGLPNSILEISKDANLVTVCNSGGGRSERAAELLRNSGWVKTKWLEGGYLGWIEAGLPDFEPGFASSSI